MEKFMAFMEKYVVPVASKMGAQKHLIAIRDGFVSIMPLIMAGSLAVMINNIPIPGYADFMAKIFGAEWGHVQGTVWNGTFGVMSLILVVTMAYSLGKSYDKDAMACVVVCFAVAAMLYAPGAAGDAFKGTNGLFVALAIPLIFGTIFCKLLGNPKLLIKMPEGVPPAVAKGFAAILPTIIVLALVGIIEAVLLWVFGINNIHKVVSDAIQKPFMDMFSSSIVPVLILILFQQLFWFMGLHGANLVAPIVNTVLLPLTLSNIDAFSLGQEPTSIITSQFLDSFVNLGGSGATIALLIAIFLVSKSKSSKSIAKISLAPGLFNINEPVIFGMPIVLNPIYIAPFIIAPLVCAVIAYYATSWGFIPTTRMVVHWTTPPVLSAFIATASFKAGLIALINVVISVGIYLPFVKVADRKAAIEESQGLAQ
ncbi:PTS sugar transporter subunit IIC [Clostridium gasigenes]|uniref:Permease IIC component n=1 Tax=Clostridium gasigenes TaxID=94869 RepID=A0A1H0VTL7_9CLOT|nr:PTS transporter subunit EIIC [Clostridium gasigenes]MBB6622522.1 PTS sugar transporter subunit IIC [Clostridium gasigenes]MBB6714169.1 PTS sugar transporter subunit IIC [Clostridium gasigenes]MBU3088502.1 PTS transporter subunit EIIC [Clostridium gasigenes]SDP81515.1 PTS system, cellobiose-specific IIC component [Clostridium gasigenes]